MKYEKLFYWTAVNTAGKKISGTLLAKDKKELVALLELKQFTVLTIKPEKHFLKLTTKDFTQKDLLDFTQQLQILLHSEIHLLDTLSLIIKTSATIAASKIITKVQEKIIGGFSFSSALAEFPHYFNTTYCQIISAGEKSGQLNTALLQLIRMLEQQRLMKNKIRKAFFYPMIVLCLAVCMTIGMLIFVIPQFGAIYRNFGAQLPAMTQLLINVSHLILEHAVWCLTFLCVVITTLKKVVSNPMMRAGYQHLLFFISPIRSLIVTQQISQWSELLSTLLCAYIPLIDAMQIANNSISHLIIQKELKTVREKMITGVSFYHALDTCKNIPTTAKQMIAIGENADALAMMLQKIATIYQQKLNDTLGQLTQLIEPIMMVGVSGLIAGLIIAMYLPIFRMGSII